MMRAARFFFFSGDSYFWPDPEPSKKNAFSPSSSI
jgi:hypothetical protein